MGNVLWHFIREMFYDILSDVFCKNESLLLKILVELFSRPYTPFPMVYGIYIYIYVCAGKLLIV